VCQKKKKGGKKSTVSQRSSHIFPPIPMPGLVRIRETAVATYSASTQLVPSPLRALVFLPPLFSLVDQVRYEKLSSFSLALLHTSHVRSQNTTHSVGYCPLPSPSPLTGLLGLAFPGDRNHTLFPFVIQLTFVSGGKKNPVSSKHTDTVARNSGGLFPSCLYSLKKKEEKGVYICLNCEIMQALVPANEKPFRARFNCIPERVFT